MKITELVVVTGLLVSTGTAVVLPTPANAKGCLGGAALGAVAGHYTGHTFWGMFSGCAAGHFVYKMYTHWKENHPNGTMHDFVQDNRQNLPPGWTDRLEALGSENVPPHRTQ